MDVRLLYPSLYLAAPEFKGKDVVLTIRQLAVESLKTERGEEKRPVLYFKETQAKAPSPAKEKRLVLNKTNAMAIAEVWGRETDAWVGKRITLYPTRVSAFGSEVDAIRVRATKPIAADTTTGEIEEEATDGQG